jgi:hypothetical protein
MNHHFYSLETASLMALLAFDGAGPPSTLHGVRGDLKKKGL